MPGLIKKTTIDQIRMRGDIVDLIQSYIPLKRAGRNFKALCPFHSEKTPSFMVNPDSQTYHCFGCNRGGNIFRFVMEKENMDFVDAIHFLADRYGVSIEYQKGKPDEESATNKISKERLYKIQEFSMRYFRENLMSNTHSTVSLYLESRRVPVEIISFYQLGESLDSWDACLNRLRSAGFNDDEINASGMAVLHEEKKTLFDRFRKRLMFPVWDELGRIVGFSARAVEEKYDGGKYINSPETPIFKKNRLLYGLNFARDSAREKKNLILCEGQFDTIAFHRAGCLNAVAPLGTAFSEEQARIIKRYSDTLILALDADEAGTKAALRNIEILLSLDFKIAIIRFPDDEDPDSMLEKYGSSALVELVENPVDFFDFAYSYYSSSENINTPWGKDHVIQNMLKLLNNVNSSVVRTAYCSQLASLTGTNEESVFTELKRLRNSQNTRRNDQIDIPARFHGNTDPIVNAESLLLKICLSTGAYCGKISHELPPEMLNGNPVGEALETVLSMFLQGEWEHAMEKLNEKLTVNSDPVLTRVITSQEDSLSEEKIEKAVNDCILKIKEAHIRKAINSLLNNLKTCKDDSQKEKLTAEYHEKNTVLKEIIKSQRQTK